MCGIVCAVASRPIGDILIEGLKKLEYRGYDSAGMAVIDKQTELQRLRVVGKVRELEIAFTATPIDAQLGIAHTRWATHGIPSEQNAHPFISNNQFALVHNGIIENHAELREKLIKLHYQFSSDTDTETVVHLIHHHFTQCLKDPTQKNPFLAAVRATVNELKGAYALGVCCVDYPDRIIGVRQGAPLVVGKGRGENFLASDPLALLALTRDFIYLEDDDIADITQYAVHIYDKHNEEIKRDTHNLTIGNDSFDRGSYQHFMLKEIMEQPRAVINCLEGRVSKSDILPGIFGPKADEVFAQVDFVKLIACGTSFHAALIAKYWLERLAHIPCSVEIASEFRYRESAQPKNSLFVAISQSGETADTLGAMRLAKKLNYLSTLAICNVPASTMVREAELHFLMHAGVEIGVASTKAFMTQLIALFLLTLNLYKQKNNDAQHHSFISECIAHLQQLPESIKKILAQNELVKNWAKTFMHKSHALFIGRGLLYPIALEGALKMKEISYIHAEGYASGELKHGPLALVDSQIPIIATVPNDELYKKNLSNIQEIHARGGKLFIFTDQPQEFKNEALTDAHVFTMPSCPSSFTPMLYSVPLQLLAYHVAVLKGTDVDQPRNLAKSVTVE